VYNSTADGFDIPELASLPNGTWASTDGGGWQGLTGWVEIYHVGYADVTVYIDLHEILASTDDTPHSGLITMGDNNWKEIENERFGVVDQGNLVKEPIRPEWVIGKVVGEIPWIGTIRLWITGTMPPYMPVNSIVMLVAFLTSIAALPAALWLSARALEHRRGG
jgi:signal peptidase